MSNQLTIMASKSLMFVLLLLRLTGYEVDKCKAINEIAISKQIQTPRVRSSPQKLAGVYMAPGGVMSNYSLLRFYDDGTVLYVEGQPLKKLIGDFNKNIARTNACVYSGRYCCRNNKITFSVRSLDFDFISFKGEARKHELRLKQGGHIYADNRVAYAHTRLFKF